MDNTSVPCWVPGRARLDPRGSSTLLGSPRGDPGLSSCAISLIPVALFRNILHTLTPLTHAGWL